MTLHCQGCQKVFKWQADNEQQVALELAPKAQVLEGRGIQGHFGIQSLGNAISRGFQEVFFHRGHAPCCFIRIHTRLRTMSPQCSNVSQIETCLNTRSMSFIIIIQWYLFFDFIVLLECCSLTPKSTPGAVKKYIIQIQPGLKTKLSIIFIVCSNKI